MRPLTTCSTTVQDQYYEQGIDTEDTKHLRHHKDPSYRAFLATATTFPFH